MNDPAILGVLAGPTAALAIAISVRRSWIGKKLSALNLPPKPIFVFANLELPPKGARLRVVLIGDSRASQWPTDTWTQNLEIVNRGIGGETAAQLAGRFRHDALDLKPDVVLVQSGINDLVAATFMRPAERDLIVGRTADVLLKLARASAASGVMVGISTVIPAARVEVWRVLIWRRVLRDLTVQLNQNLRSLALPPKVVLLDFASALDAGDARILANRYRLSTLHLNRQAYTCLASIVEALFRDAWRQRSEAELMQKMDENAVISRPLVSWR